MSLTPCPECSRHVRRAESHCPFCGSAVPEAPRPEGRRQRGRVSILFGVSLAAASLGGCGGGNEVADPAPTSEDGAGGEDALADDEDAPPEEDASPPEEGARDPDPDLDDGGNVPLYGTPAPEGP